MELLVQSFHQIAIYHCLFSNYKLYFVLRLSFLYHFAENDWSSGEFTGQVVVIVTIQCRNPHYFSCHAWNSSQLSNRTLVPTSYSARIKTRKVCSKSILEFKTLVIRLTISLTLVGSLSTSCMFPVKVNNNSKLSDIQGREDRQFPLAD